MAIQIPQIKRNAPQGSESIGRVEAQAPSSEPYLRNIETATKTLGNMSELFFKYQKDAQDNNVRELANMYKMKLYGDGTEDENTWTVNRFQRTPKEGQDFTGNYQSYNQYRDTLREQILSQAGSGAVRQKLEQEMSETDFYANRTVNVEYLKSNNVRTEKIYEADINGRMTIDLPDAVAFYNSKDPSTKERLRSVIEGIVNSTKEYSVKTFEFSEDDPVLKSKLEEIRGNAAAMAAQDALNTRDTEKASEIFKEYESSIPLNLSKNIKAKLAKVEEDKLINGVVDKYMPYDEEAGRAKIMQEVPEPLLDEVLDRYRAEKRQEIVRRNSISNERANLLKEAALKKRYRTVNEFLVDHGEVYQTLTPENKRGVLNFIGFRPSVGDNVKYVELMEKGDNGQLQAMPEDQFQKETDPLNSEQYKKVLAKRIGDKIKPGVKEADRKKVRSGVLLMSAPNMPKDLYDPSTGKLNQDGKMIWYEFVEPFIENEMNAMPPNMTDLERREFEKQIRQKVKSKLGRIKNLKDFRTVFPTIQQPAKTNVVEPLSPVPQTAPSGQGGALKGAYEKPGSSK